MSRPQLTDSAEVLHLIAKNQIAIEKAPWRSVIFKKYGDGASTGIHVPRQLMSCLIGSGWVEPDGLGWSGGSWVYRLTTRGKQVEEALR